MSAYALYHGDCLDILPTLDAQSVDAVICDPPYGTTACKWDSAIPFEPMWAGIRRVLKPRGACVLFGSQPFTSALVMSNPTWFRYEWVWNKVNTTGFLDVNRRPMKKHENIVVFAAGEHVYNPVISGSAVKSFGKKTLGLSSVYGKFGKEKQHGIGYPQSIITFQRPTNITDPEYGLHPTQKPRALLEYLVKTYTNEGDTVLDFCMGSGTTGAACGNLGRSFIGIEKDGHYIDLAADRIATAYAPLRLMGAAS